MIKKFFLTSYQLLRDATNELLENDPLRMAGATAFFTTFALPPIIIIIVRTLGIFFNRRTFGTRLFEKLNDTIGTESAEQIRGIIRSFRSLESNMLITILSFVFLLFVATTLFRVIKNSLNQLWNIRVETHRSVKLKLSSRLHSVVIILFAGVLFLLVFLIDGIVSLFGNYLLEIAPTASLMLITTFNQAISIIVITAWFFVLFIYLPDGRPTVPVARMGAFVTALLFNIGKILLNYFLSRGNIGTIYGTSGAMVILLLFVFYSSIILYFGAAFTKVWAEYRKKPIRALPHAVKYHLTAVDIKEK